MIHERRATLALLAVAAIAALSAGCSKPGTAPGGPGSSGSATPSGPPVTLEGYVGGEKLKFLQNEKIQQILAEKHGVTIRPTKAGSLEMVSGTDLTGKDFLWPSNDLAVDLFRRNGGKIRRDQIVFNSPIVIYTGWNIANALSQKGIVEKRPQGYFIVKFREMLNLITEQKSWKDIGLNFSGPFLVRCTDPTKSNSGNMFAGLVANTLNDGTVVDEQSVEKVLPDLKKFFSRLGMMERSSDDIFRKFIAVGTTNSLVVGYESQIVEFIVSNPRSRELIQNSVCVLYPEPTIWSSHPVISLNEKGDRLIEAMLDEQVQKLAWSEHGFRSGLVGVTIDPSAVNLPFMPETIDNVIGLPSSKTFQRILDALQGL